MDCSRLFSANVDIMRNTFSQIPLLNGNFRTVKEPELDLKGRDGFAFLASWRFLGSEMEIHSYRGVQRCRCCHTLARSMPSLSLKPVLDSVLFDSAILLSGWLCSYSPCILVFCSCLGNLLLSEAPWTVPCCIHAHCIYPAVSSEFQICIFGCTFRVSTWVQVGSVQSAFNSFRRISPQRGKSSICQRITLPSNLVSEPGPSPRASPCLPLLG